MELNTESDIQFLARMLLNTREGHQIAGQDLRRLQNLSQFGSGPVPPTPPEVHNPRNPSQKRQLLEQIPAARDQHGAPVR
jgi:hypothetical protein